MLPAWSKEKVKTRLIINQVGSAEVMRDLEET
jgi:hypothetical protein